MAKQPNQVLTNYIWNYLHQGYSLTSIRTQLKRNGYADSDINLAIDYVYANYYYGKNQSNDPRPTYAQATPKHSGFSFSSIHSVVPIVLIIFGVLLFGFAFIFIMFTGTSQEVPVTPVDIVLDDPIEEDPIPDAEDPAVPALDPVEPEVVEDNPDPVTPEPVVPAASGVDDPYDARTDYTPRQIDLKVAYFGTKDPKEAMKFCEVIDRDIEKYFCYSDVAQYSGNYLYCQSIPEQKYRDDCYLNLVLEDSSQGETCSFIENDFKKNNCETVSEYAQLEFEDIDIPTVAPELDPADFASPADFY